jgi:ABC-type multidrug transport system ATPase subunit
MRLEISGVSKSFGPAKGLDNISAVLGPGEVVAVVGLNGAGKTTLLRTLAAVVGSDSGKISFDGQPFCRDRLDLRKRLAFLPDLPPLVSTTVARHVATVLKLYDKVRPGLAELVVSLLKELEVLAYVEAQPITLPRGQAYKVALATVVAAEVDLWLVDEPFASGMDPLGIEFFKRRARGVSGRGGTVVYSTQILEVAERFSDRVCVLHEGRIVAFDRVGSLTGAAANQAGPIMELLGKLKEARP